MHNDDHTKEYFKKWQGVKLSQEARDRMAHELSAYAKFHRVRVGEGNRSIEQVRTRTSLIRLLTITRTHMTAAVLALALVVGGGTSYAAQVAVPGDFFYPVKTEINENVRSALAINAEAQARLQAEFLEERVEEAEILAAEGRLRGETATEVSLLVEEQAEEAERAAVESEDDVELASRNRIKLAVLQFNVLVEGDADLEVTGGSYFAADEGDTEVGTSLMMAPIDIEVVIENTESRIEGLRETIVKHESEFEASVYTRMQANLDAAAQLLIEARAETGERKEALTYQAADRAGAVESELSLLGTVSIDPETGAIIDIDTTNVPPREYEGDRVIDLNLEGDGTVGGDAEVGSGTIEIDMDIDADTSVDTGVINLETETSVEATSGLSL